MDSILVGYNGSDGGQRALDRAARVAEITGGRLVVATVAEVLLSPELPATDEFLDPVPVDFIPPQPEEVEEALVAARTVLEARGLEADYVWTSGEPAGALLGVARDQRATLLVIGTHHESFFERLFGASVTDEVTQGAECDVLVVR